MRRIISFIIVFSFMAAFLLIHHFGDETLPNELLLYYKHNYYKDTAAQNIVTAIYLNYRVYDTLFEALMLLVSVIGIIHFSRHEGGEHHE